MALLSALTFNNAGAQESGRHTDSVKDTLSSQAGKSERNMMLNAETSSEPREINIGLPDSGNGANLYIDGNKHALGLVKSRYHWSGGNAYAPVGTMGLMESVIKTGEIGVMAVSDTKLGTDRLETVLTVATSIHGMAKADFAISGPVKKGWYYSAGLFVNFDPNGVPAPNRYFTDKKQIGILSLTKRWTNASLSAIYRLSFCQDNIENGYSYAPFIYNGDGTVSEYDGFRIGRDCYFPKDDTITYLETDTARKITKSIADIDNRRIHDIALRADYMEKSGWKLALDAHLCYMPRMESAVMTPSGIYSVNEAGGYSYRDGGVFTGPVQIRMATVKKMTTADGFVNFKADRRFGHHELKTGLDIVASAQSQSDATVNFAHTVTPDPQRLLYGGNDSWLYNTSAAWFKATKQDIIAYGFDEMSFGSRVRNKIGARARYSFNQISCANVTEGSAYNIRTDGFNIKDPQLCRLNDISHNGLDGAVSESLSCRMVDRVFFVAEGFWSLTSKTTTYFKGAAIPSLKPIGNALARGGFCYDNKWMDATLMVSYITSWNNAKVLNVTAEVDGEPKTIQWTAQYGIGTLGVTFDGNFHWKGFRLHTLVTWQDPRYKNYTNEFRFSEDVVKKIDYTGKYVTGISQWMLEFDPSYDWDRLRLWASVRYYSKQYASRNNLAYFNGHFESFAGADCSISPSHTVSAKVINLFYQNGIKGSIDTADTVEKAEMLQGILMAGTYIRPFTVELSYTYKF